MANEEFAVWAEYNGHDLEAVVSGTSPGGTEFVYARHGEGGYAVVEKTEVGDFSFVGWSDGCLPALGIVDKTSFIHAVVLAGCLDG